MIRKYLKKTFCSDSEQKVSTGGRPQGTIEAGSVRHISKWLNKQGEVYTTTVVYGAPKGLLTLILI